MPYNSTAHKIIGGRRDVDEPHKAKTTKTEDDEEQGRSRRELTTAVTTTQTTTRHHQHHAKAGLGADRTLEGGLRASGGQGAARFVFGRRGQCGLGLGSCGQGVTWRVVSVLASFIAVRDRASTCEEPARPAVRPPATHCEQCYAELASVGLSGDSTI